VTTATGISMAEAVALAEESQPPGPPPPGQQVATVNAGACAVVKVE